MSAPFPVTPEGIDKLRAELKRYREIERPKNVADIETARAHGDLSENAEYKAAKERQSFIEGMIGDLEDKLGRANVIDPRTLSGDRVVFGATVTLHDLERNEEVTYKIVGDIEADTGRNWLSISSPISRALVGKHEGDEVEVRTPGGARRYEIIEVRFL